MDAGFLQPAYGERSLADVLPSVGTALGVPIAGQDVLPIALPAAPAYVVFLVDGLGADLLAAHGHAAPYLFSLLKSDSTATAGVPSTTATSLTSLGTGLVPGVVKVTATYAVQGAMVAATQKNLVDTLGSQLDQQLRHGTAPGASTYPRIGQLIAIAVANTGTTSNVVPVQDRTRSARRRPAASNAATHASAS